MKSFPTSRLSPMSVIRRALSASFLPAVSERRSGSSHRVEGTAIILTVEEARGTSCKRSMDIGHASTSPEPRKSV